MSDAKRTDLKDKSLKKESLGRHQKADTGGDHFDRHQGQYSKNAPVKESDPYLDYI